MAELSPAVLKAIEDAKLKAAAKPPTPKILPPKVFTREEIAAAILEVPTLADTANDEVEHTILYGPPGTGKTTQAGLLAEFFNILWFDGDKGMTALINNLHPELLKRIRPIKIMDNTANPFMVATMLKVVTGRQVRICFIHGAVDCPVCKGTMDAKFATIALNMLPLNWVAVMDSQTQFVASALALTHYKVNTGQLNKGDTDDFWRGIEGDMFAYWGGMKNVVDKFGNYMKDLKCQFISISHETLVEQEDKTKGSQMVPVSGSDNSSRSYAKYYGTEVHCKKVNNTIIYETSAVGSNNAQSKSRANVILEKESTPALLHIFRPKEAKELLEGSYTEWYLKEGWKHPSERKLPMPIPKGVLST